MRVEHSPIQHLSIPPARPATEPRPGVAPSFADALSRAGSDLRLSRHAQKRVDHRDLNLDAARLHRLQGAVDKAAARGAKNSVVMLDELAVVVDVRERTVITAMSQQGGRERVFTNIDSVVIA